MTHIDDLPMTAKLVVLVEGAIAAGVRSAALVADEEGRPATITDCHDVALLRVIDESQPGNDRIDVFLVEHATETDTDVRLDGRDKLFTVVEHGSDPPELHVHNRDVQSWLSPVLLSLAQKCAANANAGCVGHA
jgi:hypothetical protein